MSELLVIYLDRFMGLCVPIGMSWCATIEEVDQLPHSDMMLVYDMPSLRGLPWCPTGAAFGEDLDLTPVMAKWHYDPASETWRRRGPEDQMGFTARVTPTTVTIQLLDHHETPRPFHGFGAFFVAGEAQPEFPITHESVVPIRPDAHGLFVRLLNDTAGTIFSLENRHEANLRPVA